MTDGIALAGRALAAADRAAALTGAGASTESGIPAFRTEGGIWERFDQSDFSIHRFERDPGGFWADWLSLHDAAFDGGAVKPNPAHRALADLEAAGHLAGVVTQNVDGLHRAAGSENVLELHGSGDRVVCRSCDRRSAADPAVERARAGERPPRCGECDGVLEPDSVLFGERLPEHAHLRAHALAEDADVFLVVGSSLTVEPAASLPRTAAETGADLVVVNREETYLADRADFVFRDDASTVLDALASAVLAD